MGRPREHDERTRTALLAAAEQIVAERGPGALSVRAVAAGASTSTRAVYSLFGSKEGLLVEALAHDAFTFLYTEIAKLEETNDVVADLLDVGMVVFRRLIHEHPALYRIAFQRIAPGLTAGNELTAARQKAWTQLVGKVQRLESRGLLGNKPAPDAAVEFNAMMEGLSNAELRGAVLRLLPAGDEEQAWRNALMSVVRGWRAEA